MSRSRPIASRPRCSRRRSRGEGLAADLRPAGRVDEKGEHVLLSEVEARPAGRSLLGELEIDGELHEHRHEVGVEKPRVAVPVDRPHLPPRREELNRLVPSGHRLPEDLARRLRREAIDRVLGNARKPAELREAPVIEFERPVVAKRQHEAVSKRVRDEHVGRLPPVDGPLPVVTAMREQRRERFKPFVRLTPEQLLMSPSEICHGCKLR